MNGNYCWSFMTHRVQLYYLLFAVYRLTALQQSGLYEVFADYLYPVQRYYSECHVCHSLLVA